MRARVSSSEDEGEVLEGRHEMIRKALYSLLMLASASIGSAALAEDSCTNWLLQSDGSEWRQCVRDNGSVYCQRRANGQITNISCLA
jgi:hypothetical protein